MRNYITLLLIYLVSFINAQCVENVSVFIDIEEGGLEDDECVVVFSAAWEPVEGDPQGESLAAIFDVEDCTFQCDAQIGADAEELEQTFEWPCGDSLTYSFSIISDASEDSLCFFQTETIIIKPEESLPIVISDFTVEQEREDVVIKFSTESEEDSDKVEIHRSQDANTWRNIGSIPSNNEPSYYSFIDQTAPQGLNYYSLVQYDFDGTVTISDYVSLMVEKKNQPYPNPAKDFVYINGKRYDMTQYSLGLHFIEGYPILKI